MAKTYTGVAAYTQARTKAGGYAFIYAGDPVPEDITDDDLSRLVGEGFLAVDPEAADAAQSPKAGTAESVLAEVGDDPAKAAAALKAEQEQDKPRSTLVSKLQAIANPA